MDSPCKDCKKRHVGCHSECPEYLEYKAKIEQRKETERLENLKPVYRKPVPADMYRKKWKKSIRKED